MTRASRRRRRQPGRGLGPWVLVAIAATVTIVLVSGSIVAIHTQSKDYRDATTIGYASLADHLGSASTQTGAQLAALMAKAPDLTNQKFPDVARGTIQQGLDAAVAASGNQAAQAVHIDSPPPVGDLGSRFTQVMNERASATKQIRSTIDRLLGMQPLPIAGAPSTGGLPAEATLISADQASSELSGAGRRLEAADAAFRSLRASAAGLHLRLRLRPSVWVSPPVASAPLGPLALQSLPTALVSSAALVPFHQLVVTAVGLRPAAVPVGGVGSVSTSCTDPRSVAPDSSATVVPPTATLGVLVSVSNCGNIPESGVIVRMTVRPSDPAGTAPAPVGKQGGQVRAVVSIAPGWSSAPSLRTVPVASGHRYTLTVSVSLPLGQADGSGSSQSFLVQVAS